jgi:sulfite exporter TauE/SafE
MVPYIIDRRYKWLYSLKLGLIFNIPRIIILTALGAIAGYLTFQYGKMGVAWLNIPTVIGYSALGLVLVAFGILMFTKNNSCVKKRMPKKCRQDVLQKMLTKLLQKKPDCRILFFLWGSILSIACIGEITIIEGFMVGGAAGFISTDIWSAIFFGSCTMFVFAIGATMPVIVVTTFSGKISERLKDATIKSIRLVGAMLMIMIGFLIICGTVQSIIF